MSVFAGYKDRGGKYMFTNIQNIHEISIFKSINGIFIICKVIFVRNVDNLFILTIFTTKKAHNLFLF